MFSLARKIILRGNESMERLRLCDIYVHFKFRTRYYIFPVGLLSIWNHKTGRLYSENHYNDCTLKNQCANETKRENGKTWTTQANVLYL